MTSIFRFLLRALLIYIAWFVLYEQWLHPEGTLDSWIIRNSLSLSSGILHLLNYEAVIDVRQIRVEEKAGLFIGDACNGLNLIVLFIGFIIAFPGPVKSKIIFSIIGAVSIHLLNVIRIVALSLIQLHRPESLDFNHTYTFTFLIYIFIFFLWMLWVNKFSKIKKSDAPEK